MSKNISEKMEIFLCLLIFHVSLLMLSLILLMAYFINIRWAVATPLPLIAMYLSYRKGRGDRLL